MIAPLELTTEELEIFRLLYLKSNFEDMTVKYTLDQLSMDSNSKLSITKKKASLIIKKFIECNYILVLSKGSKGNPTVYKINKMTEIEKHKSNLKETQRELKGNTNETNKPSYTSSLEDFEKHKGNLKETQRELKGNTKVTPIKEKDKEKENIYINIYEYYLSLELIKHKSLTLAMKKAIDKAMKENKYSVEDCKELLNRHKRISVIMKDNPKFKIRTLHEFFGQKIYNSTNLICTQYDIGGCYYNMAIENIEKEKPKEDVKQTIDVEAIIQRLRGEANV